VLAQKALSAVARLKESVGTGMVIDVLRGSARQEIRRNGYDRIKTYGVGRDVSTFDWNQYFNQLISLGYLYVAHEDYNKVKLPAAARRVLFDGEKVELVKMATVKKRREQENAKTKQRAKVKRDKLGLFDELRELRKELAREFGIPPYLVFNDATLQEMVAAKPITDAEFGRISGVGERKLHRYGEPFMTVIRKHVRREDKELRGNVSTHEHTYQSYVGGESVADIAARRRLSETTVISHLAKCYAEGQELDLEPFLGPKATAYVEEAIEHLPAEGLGAKAILEYVTEKYGPTAIDYTQIRFVHAQRQRQPLAGTGS
ncbi:MAG: RQC domain-containing protein, partial [Bacteroidota bacterium]